MSNFHQRWDHGILAEKYLAIWRSMQEHVYSSVWLYKDLNKRDEGDVQTRLWSNPLVAWIDEMKGRSDEWSTSRQDYPFKTFLVDEVGAVKAWQPNTLAVVATNHDWKSCVELDVRNARPHFYTQKQINRGKGDKQEVVYRCSLSFCTFHVIDKPAVILELSKDTNCCCLDVP